MLLYLASGNRESYESWLDFLRDLVKCGLRTAVMISTDGAPGLIRAVAEVFAHSLRQKLGIAVLATSLIYVLIRSSADFALRCSSVTRSRNQASSTTCTRAP